METGIVNRISNSQDQTVFWSVLQDSAKEALKNALGDVILGILTGQKMLENPEDVARFTERLRAVFGASGAKTLQFVITKELYKRLGFLLIPTECLTMQRFLNPRNERFPA